MEKTDQKPLQKEKRTRSAGRIAGMAVGIAVGVLAAAYLAVCIAAAAGRTTLHRTRVLGRNSKAFAPGQLLHQLSRGVGLHCTLVKIADTDGEIGGVQGKQLPPARAAGS